MRLFSIFLSLFATFQSQFIPALQDEWGLHSELGEVGSEVQVFSALISPDGHLMTLTGWEDEVFCN